jgi:hypothetical protein
MICLQLEDNKCRCAPSGVLGLVGFKLKKPLSYPDVNLATIHAIQSPKPPPPHPATGVVMNGGQSG